ncbi:MAG: ABC transporter ATP-binding protein [Bacteroidetes bacterium]|nr:ABC transporter ATP-binding protein [Bacteroidota bacterium]
MSYLSITNLTKIYNEEKVVDQISFTIEKGIKLGIAGETGAAKTTVLKLIAGLLQPDSGQIFLNEVKVEGPEDRLLPGHPAIGYLSQHFELRNNYRVEEELEMASNMDASETSRIVSICKISHLLKRKTNALSGGERQRIVLAKTLVKKPSLLLLDEPFSNLDPAHKSQMKDVLCELASTLSITMILVSHDGSDLLSWADDLIVIQKGKIVQRGTPEALFSNPADTYTAGLLGPFNRIDEADFILLKPIFLKNLPASFPIILRPSQLTLAIHDQAGVLATICKSSFMGGYWLVQVLIVEKLITVQSVKAPPMPGSRVWVSLLQSL